MCWPYAAVGETFHMACPAVFSLFGNNTGAVDICHSEGQGGTCVGGDTMMYYIKYTYNIQ